MNYEELQNDNDFHKWHKYEPLDAQYIRYAEKNPSAIAAGHKICDVYHAFANAKQSFRCAGYDNYGDISATDEISKLYAKTHFLLNAVSEYALCLDLSWQVVWAYIQPSSFEYLLNLEYKKMERECDRDNLHEQLDCAISQKSMKAVIIKSIIVDFDNNPDVMKLRTLNNSIKHQGTIHFEGLGENFSSMMMTVNNNEVSTLSRKSYTIQEVEDLLFTFHVKFQEYFNRIIQEIMPEDFLDNKIPFGQYLETILQMNEVQNQKK